MENCGVYRIKCVMSGRYYVGSSVNLDRRVDAHFRSLQKGQHHNIFLQRTYDKYGEVSFEVDYKYTSDETSARDLEQYYLNKFSKSKNLMNIGKHAVGGDNISGHPHRDSIAKRIRKSIRRRMKEMSDEERKSMFGLPGELNGMYGKTHSLETREKISSFLTGRPNPNARKPKSEEGRKNIQKAARKRVSAKGYVNSFKGKTHSAETRAVLSKLAKARIDAGILPSNTRRIKIGKKIYRSLSFAARQLGVVAGTVHNRLKSNNYPEYRYLD